jgi:hypothetical protein
LRSFAGPATRPAVALEVTSLAEPFDGGFLAGERAPAIPLADQGRRLVLAKGRGWFDTTALTGALADARSLAEIDAFLRLALSVALPRRGVLLLHAAAVVPSGGKGALVLCGHSGAGKSTAAFALGQPLCDELTALAVGAPATVYGTPYWCGRAESYALAHLICLERGQPSATRRNGSQALGALAPHLVRYSATSDAEQLALAARLCAVQAVTELCCPIGDAFLPFLRRALGPADSAEPLLAPVD